MHHYFAASKKILATPGTGIILAQHILPIWLDFDRFAHVQHFEQGIHLQALNERRLDLKMLAKLQHVSARYCLHKHGCNGETVTCQVFFPRDGEYTHAGGETDMEKKGGVGLVCVKIGGQRLMDASHAHVRYRFPRREVRLNRPAVPSERGKRNDSSRRGTWAPIDAENLCDQD